MKNLMSIIVFILFLFSACDKVDYMDPDLDPGDGDISIKVATQDGEVAETATTEAGETIFMVESNKQFIFSYETDMSVDYVIWEFWDGQESFDNNPIYFYGGYDMKSIKLTIVDTNNNQHEVMSYLNLFPAYPEPPFYITNVEESGNKFLITAGIYKNAWHDVSGNYYFIGTITDIPWDGYQMINPADTNFRMSSNGELYPAEGVGHWVKTQLELDPGDHNFGVVRFYNNDPIWGNFKNSNFVTVDEPTLISFHLKDNGEIIPVVPIPGENGDQGPSAVLRFTINSNNSITVYVNLDGNYSSGDPWWSYLDHNEQWYSPIDLEPVPDFPNWGKFHISDMEDFPVKMVWGLYEDQENNNMSQSIFWDNYYQYIFLQIIS